MWVIDFSCAVPRRDVNVGCSADRRGFQYRNFAQYWPDRSASSCRRSGREARKISTRLTWSCTDIRWPIQCLREDGTVSTQQVARKGAGVLALIDHDNAIDDHRLDAFRVLVRIVKAGAVGDRLGVEDDEIGGVAHGDGATLRKAKRRSRTAG